MTSIAITLSTGVRVCVRPETWDEYCAYNDVLITLANDLAEAEDDAQKDIIQQRINAHIWTGAKQRLASCVQDAAILKSLSVPEAKELCRAIGKLNEDEHLEKN